MAVLPPAVSGQQVSEGSEQVVVGPLITSRKPADLEAFCDQILKRLVQGRVKHRSVIGH